jgi:hypothetical protein
MDWRDLRPKLTSEVAATRGVCDGRSRRRVSGCQLTHDAQLPAEIYPERRHVRHADLTFASTVEFSLRAVA